MLVAGKRAATETFAQPRAQSTLCIMYVSYFCLLLSVSEFLRQPSYHLDSWCQHQYHLLLITHTGLECSQVHSSLAAFIETLGILAILQLRQLAIY